MARQLKRLTARTVASMKKVGRHADGGNLYLTISRPAAGLSKRWTFMYSFAGKQREAGLGPAAAVTLAEAREKAARYRSMLAKGIAPQLEAVTKFDLKKAILKLAPAIAAELAREKRKRPEITEAVIAVRGRNTPAAHPHTVAALILDKVNAWLRVCPVTSCGITKSSEHETD